ncbi:hypothetical protein Dimus_026788 [Dionaea muscipula]
MADCARSRLETRHRCSTPLHWATGPSNAQPSADSSSAVALAPCGRSPCGWMGLRVMPGYRPELGYVPVQLVISASMISSMCSGLLSSTFMRLAPYELGLLLRGWDRCRPLSLGDALGWAVARAQPRHAMALARRGLDWGWPSSAFMYGRLVLRLHGLLVLGLHDFVHELGYGGGSSTLMGA